MKYLATLDGEEREYRFERRGGRLLAYSGDQTVGIDVAAVGDGVAMSLLIDSHSYDVVADVSAERIAVQLLGERFLVQVEDERERAAHAVAGQRGSGKREVRAAMPGIVVAVEVEVGASVEAGQTLIVLEAMKMQNPLCAEAAGTVARVLVKPGEAVAAGALLVEVE